MAQYYRALVANPPRVPDVIGINQLPGRIIMHQVPVPVPARTMVNLFTHFCAYYHSPGHWTWDGGPATPAAERLLDGDAMVGQCQSLARALRMLATLPWPGGLGLPAAQVGDPGLEGKYRGRYSKGFISAHPLGGVLSLMPNVFDLSNVNFTLCHPAPFYHWADHKVVPFGGIFYDPSYRRTWNRLPEMATYHVMTDDVNRRNVPGYPPAEIHSFVKVDDFSGTVRYFRYLTMTECNVRNVRMGALQGPYPGPQPPGLP